MTQQDALALLESGRSLLLTGAAGTGKTYVLNQFVRRAKARGKHVAVTATTGLAATHLHGTTIHAWAGIGVRDQVDSHLLKNVAKSRRDLMQRADVLIIDEISMLHDFRLDMVDEMLREVRGSLEPFGGLQVVLCGDFFQLPPVNRRDSRKGGFITSSEVWQKNVFDVCYLQTQYRQSNDALYTNILNSIRAGMMPRTQLNALQERRQAIADPFTPYTRLLTVNIDVDDVNHLELEQLNGDVHEYEADVTGAKQYREQLVRSCLAPETLRLKLGAQVMCIKNSPDKKYANGSLGKVVGFEAGTDHPQIELTSGRTITVRPDSWELMDGETRRAQLTQLPLRLAWAITVHKSQGMTLDAARIDLSKAFVEGMGYVALSRVKGLRHLVLDGLNGMALKVSPEARRIDTELRQKSDHTQQQHAALITQWHDDEAKGLHDAPPEREAVEPDANLLAALKAWRTQRASFDKVPPFIIAHDATLASVARLVPTSLAALEDVPGLGPKKIEKYGKDILATLAHILEQSSNATSAKTPS